MEKRSLLALLAAGAVVSGCTAASLERRVRDYTANQPAISPEAVKAFVDDQEDVLEDFARLAGQSSLAQIKEWRPVVDAGIHYTDVRCDKFMDSLFWLNRVREGTSRQIQYAGSAVSAALAIVDASKSAIGLTPLGFSLFDQSINNLGAGLLFNLNPSTVRVLVEKKQLAYLRSLSASYTNRTIALQVIQNYAAICLPPSIETEVERAITDQEYAPATIARPLPPAPDDLAPDPFAFVDVVGATSGQDVTSAPVTITGIGGAAPIAVIGGEYRVDAGEFTDQEGTVRAGSQVSVKARAGAPGARVDVELDVGGTKDTFSVTSAGGAPPPPPPPPPVASPGGIPPLAAASTTPAREAADGVPSPEPR